MNDLIFCPLASGSSGNAAYLATKYTRVLLDAGLTGKALQERMAEIEADPFAVDAIFITHEHTDHTKGAGILSRKFDIPIYATPGTWVAMEKDLGQIRERNRCYVYPGESFALQDLWVTPFRLPHDAAEPVGYSFATDKHKVSVATDLGHVTETVRRAVAGSHALLLEANHDVEMLKNGPYPYPLKQRILGDHGHISNETCGKFLLELARDPALEWVFLGHLSQENNNPHLAYETVAEILMAEDAEAPRRLHLDMASRYSASRRVEL